MVPKIFIVDDEAPARSRMKTLLADIAAECPHELAGEAADAQAALDGMLITRPDIVLLDVQMPGMTGIELARHLTCDPANAPAVIFVSAYDEYALKAFEVHALDYLVKPVRAARLAEAIKRAGMLTARTQQSGALVEAAATLHAKRRHFSVQERGRVLLVPVADVIYLKAEAKYVTLRTLAREFLIEESLNSIEDEFGSVFVRVHRSALASRDAIVGAERATQAVDAESDQDKTQETWQVILRGIDERLPISRRQWPAVKALIR